MVRCLLPMILAGVCLLTEQALVSRGQHAGPAPTQEGRPPSQDPQLFSPVAPATTDSELAGPAGSRLFETARLVSPWYADAEMAVLSTAALHFNEHVIGAGDSSPLFVSPRVFLGYRFESGSSIRF